MQVGQRQGRAATEGGVLAGGTDGAACERATPVREARVGVVFGEEGSEGVLLLLAADAKHNLRKLRVWRMQARHQPAQASGVY